jgi:phosphoglycolate phosphatase
MDIKEFEIYLQEKNKKHVIFDFDETLCTLRIDWENWRREMDDLFSAYEIRLDPSKIGYSKVQNYCIEKYGAKARSKILEINYKNERDCYSGYELPPITRPLLSLAKAQAKLYIWTSNDIKTVAPILAELEINKLFNKIITRNDVRYIKPDPEGFYLISDKNSPKSYYLLIGDSSSDSGAAKNAGIDFLNITGITIKN